MLKKGVSVMVFMSPCSDSSCIFCCCCNNEYFVEIFDARDMKYAVCVGLIAPSHHQIMTLNLTPEGLEILAFILRLNVICWLWV